MDSSQPYVVQGSPVGVNPGQPGAPYVVSVSVPNPTTNPIGQPIDSQPSAPPMIYAQPVTYGTPYGQPYTGQPIQGQVIQGQPYGQAYGQPYSQPYVQPIPSQPYPQQSNAPQYYSYTNDRTEQVTIVSISRDEANQIRRRRRLISFFSTFIIIVIIIIIIRSQ